MQKTILKDRDLYFDGDSAWNEDALLSQILAGILLDEGFTKTKVQGFKIKDACKSLPEKVWNIPEYYLNVDLDKLFDELSRDKGSIAIERTKYELELYRKHNLEYILRLMCYVRDEFIKKNVVWGVGRGSSVSSYLLYLLEIHLVDPIKYELNIHDFIRA